MNAIILRAITPNHERTIRKSMRDARKSLDSATTAFLDARWRWREARAAEAALPVLVYGIGYALAGRDNIATNRAWSTRIGRAERAALARASDAVEDALQVVHDAREWYRNARRRVRDIDSGAQPVRVGAAWSERGLRNVRNAGRQ